MVSRLAHMVLLALVLAGLAVPLAWAHSPEVLLRDPCALDPANLVYNGSMAPEHGTPYGSVADGWDPFIISQPPPQFRWVGNEQIDPNGSQQIVSTSTFDAGIQQTVRNLQPGVYYWFRLGYSLAAKSYSGPNVRVSSIGRKVGVDPFGGTDPQSSNVIWGPDLFDGNAALNRPEMTMTFAARSDKATLFLRAMARDGSSGENRVWMDAVCMEAKRDMATATPAAPPPTPVPPTAPPSPTVVKVAKPPPAPVTKVVGPVPTNTPAATFTPNFTATRPATATRVGTATPMATARFARPVDTPDQGSPLQVSSALLAGVGMSSLFGSFLFFAFGFVWSRRMG